MNCEDARELLVGYVLDALDADERDAVVRHLERCPDCAALATALTAAAHELPSRSPRSRAPSCRHRSLSVWNG
jgi:anti-sigma factor RsiW